MIEKEYIDELESFLLSEGFKTYREVIPEEHKEKKFPFKVDMVFFREDLGWVALEGKIFRSMRQGGKVSKAIKQIKKYIPLTYLGGIKIKKWCLTFDTKHTDEEIKKDLNIRVFIQNFLKAEGLSLLSFEKKHNKRVIIDKYSVNSIKIGDIQ